ncbi:3',5'-cyclic adenosine monophosphate phosphodiesterase CpdA [BD1-7 clade bacterium]|uniref:3',5'-cyclic adenosine monophosphate phosphodiesterase CpdA n=1 Tax=BD1-7 clade bacterium TaxID=2029982 RepID=A0A5S9PJZ1_9GAMM|nr:3',5'-cyclic adenosine monophosphate phosphodiesterase CpdA [BD1-7 clade bacterium]
MKYHALYAAMLATTVVLGGCNSDDGPQGERGLQGEQGIQGGQGAQGIQGAKGDQGEQGLQGDKGDQGVQGEKGEQGPQGEPGPAGTVDVKPEPPMDFQKIKLGVLPDTQGGPNGVALNQMEAVLEHYKANGITHVIPVGDLTDNNTDLEYEQWSEMARRYSDSITFLPLMGNHDRVPGDNYTWRRVMQEFIPRENIEHMPGRSYQTYAYTEGNTLMVQISDADQPYAYEWVETVLENRAEHVKHVFVSTHKPFAGPYRGGIIHEYVVGHWHAAEENLFMTVDYNAWRDLMARHDVTYLSGHDHQYSRSVIWAHSNTHDLTGDDGIVGAGNERRFFHHLVAGNASDKNYSVRYGEIEKAQDMIMHRTATGEGGDPRIMELHTAEDLARDALAQPNRQVNATWFDIDGDSYAFSAFFENYTASDALLNGGAQWKLFDRYTRSTTRCDKVVYPVSTHPSSVHYNLFDVNFRTVECHSPSGEIARLVDGTNRVFNRVNSNLERTDKMFDTAESPEDKAAMSAYADRMRSYMKIEPDLEENVPGSDEQFAIDGDNVFGQAHAKGFEVFERVVTEGEGDSAQDINQQVFIWYPHTYDMKKLVSLSWQAKTDATASDVLVISGIQGHTGMFTNGNGAALDITMDPGFPGTTLTEAVTWMDEELQGARKQPIAYVDYLDAKSPNRTNAEMQWTLDADLRDGDVRADDYVVEFNAVEGTSTGNLQLGYMVADQWQPLVAAECISAQAYKAEFMTALPDDISATDCPSNVAVGQSANGYWARLDFEGKFALINR